MHTFGSRDVSSRHSIFIHTRLVNPAHTIRLHQVAVATPLIPILMYGLKVVFVVLHLKDLQHFQYDVARRVSESHKSAEFHGLVLFSL